MLGEVRGGSFYFFLFFGFFFSLFWVLFPLSLLRLLIAHHWDPTLHVAPLYSSYPPPIPHTFIFMGGGVEFFCLFSHYFSLFFLLFFFFCLFFLPQKYLQLLVGLVLVCVCVCLCAGNETGSKRELKTAQRIGSSEREESPLNPVGGGRWEGRWGGFEGGEAAGRSGAPSSLLFSALLGPAEGTGCAAGGVGDSCISGTHGEAAQVSWHSAPSGTTKTPPASEKTGGKRKQQTKSPPLRVAEGPHGTRERGWGLWGSGLLPPMCVHPSDCPSVGQSGKQRRVVG